MALVNKPTCSSSIGGARGRVLCHCLQREGLQGSQGLAVLRACHLAERPIDFNKQNLHFLQTLTA